MTLKTRSTNISQLSPSTRCISATISSRVARNRPDHLSAAILPGTCSLVFTSQPTWLSAHSLYFISRHFPVVFLKFAFHVSCWPSPDSSVSPTHRHSLALLACFTFHRSQTFGGGSFHIFIRLKQNLHVKSKLWFMFDSSKFLTTRFSFFKSHFVMLFTTKLLENNCKNFSWIFSYFPWWLNNNWPRSLTWSLWCPNVGLRREAWELLELRELWHVSGSLVHSHSALCTSR